MKLSILLESLAKFKVLTRQIIDVAQAIYDQWDEDQDEYAGGGICHLIAEEIVSLLDNHGIESFSYNPQMGENHVYVIAKGDDGVYEIDIAPGVYETGSGYSWQKIPNVKFDVNDVHIGMISKDMDKFDELQDFS